MRWRVKKQCRNIPQTWCDLSNETTDLDEGYFARVKAVGTNLSSKWAFTEKRFDPKADSKLRSSSNIIFLIYELGAIANHFEIKSEKDMKCLSSPTATFGPPLVKLVMKENSVTVKLKGPMRWKTENMTKEYSLLKIYPQMTYNLSVYDNRSSKTVGVMLVTVTLCK